jgi:hypothetical protein
VLTADKEQRAAELTEDMLHDVMARVESVRSRVRPAGGRSVGAGAWAPCEARAGHRADRGEPAIGEADLHDEAAFWSRGRGEGGVVGGGDGAHDRQAESVVAVVLKGAVTGVAALTDRAVARSGYLLDDLLVGGGLELVGGHVAEGAVQPGAVVLMRVIVSRGCLVESL